jgi:hypothetical protein
MPNLVVVFPGGDGLHANSFAIAFRSLRCFAVRVQQQLLNIVVLISHYLLKVIHLHGMNAFNLAHGSFDELLHTFSQVFVIQLLCFLVQHAFGRFVDLTAARSG